MTNTPKEEITPDQLMETFQGSSVKSIILFTIIVHLVVVVGTSIPYFLKSGADKSSAALGEKERMEMAADEATKSLSEIAAKHGLKPQDLSTRLAGGAAPAAPAPAPAPAPADEKKTPAPEAAPEAAPAPAPSDIEEKLQEKKAGPQVPPVEQTEEDLFK